MGQANNDVLDVAQLELAAVNREYARELGYARLADLAQSTAALRGNIVKSYTVDVQMIVTTICSNNVQTWHDLASLPVHPDRKVERRLQDIRYIAAQVVSGDKLTQVNLSKHILDGAMRVLTGTNPGATGRLVEHDRAVKGVAAFAQLCVSSGGSYTANTDDVSQAQAVLPASLTTRQNGQPAAIDDEDQRVVTTVLQAPVNTVRYLISDDSGITAADRDLVRQGVVTTLPGNLRVA